MVVAIVTIGVLSGCAVSGHNNYTNYVGTIHGQYTPNKTGNVDVYFSGVSCERVFIQLGFVEAVGARSADYNDVLQHLKHEAWIKGADAIINVSNSRVGREYAHLFQEKDDIEHFDALTLHGVAVRYVKELSSSSVSAREGLFSSQKGLNLTLPSVDKNLDSIIYTSSSESSSDEAHGFHAKDVSTYSEKRDSEMFEVVARDKRGEEANAKGNIFWLVIGGFATVAYLIVASQSKK